MVTQYHFLIENKHFNLDSHPAGELQPADPVQPAGCSGLHTGGHRQRGPRVHPESDRHLPLLRLPGRRGGRLVCSPSET